MLNLSGDLVYALRQFRHSPVFTITAALTLALGIGGTTAIFSLMHDVMFRSLPISEPGSLFRIGSGNDCCVEGGLIRVGWFVEAADLPYELQRCGKNLLLRDRRFKVEEGLNVSTHCALPRVAPGEP